MLGRREGDLVDEAPRRRGRGVEMCAGQARGGRRLAPERAEGADSATGSGDQPEGQLQARSPCPDPLRRARRTPPVRCRRPWRRCGAGPRRAPRAPIRRAALRFRRTTCAVPGPGTSRTRRGRRRCRRTARRVLDQGISIVGRSRRARAQRSVRRASGRPNAMPRRPVQRHVERRTVTRDEHGRSRVPIGGAASGRAARQAANSGPAWRRGVHGGLRGEAVVDAVVLAAAQQDGERGGGERMALDGGEDRVEETVIVRPTTTSKAAPMVADGRCGGRSSRRGARRAADRRRRGRRRGGRRRRDRPPPPRRAVSGRQLLGVSERSGRYSRSPAPSSGSAVPR